MIMLQRVSRAVRLLYNKVTVFMFPRRSRVCKTGMEKVGLSEIWMYINIRI